MLILGNLVIVYSFIYKNISKTIGKKVTENIILGIL